MARIAKRRVRRIPEREPTLTFIGDIPLVTPRPIERLHHARRESIAHLEQLAEDGQVEIVTREVIRIEAALGVTAEDRIVVMRPLLEELDLENPQAQDRPVKKVELPDAERGRSPSDIKRFDKAVREFAKVSANPRSSVAQLDDRLKAIANIEREASERREREWLDASRKETQALEAARGGEAEVTPAGAVHCVDRDGLRDLYSRRNSPLSNEDYEIGLRYRAGCERRDADLAATDYSDSKGGGHNHDRFIWSRLSRAQKTLLVGHIERAIALDCRGHPAALTMIRWVCGLGHSLRSKGAGRAYETNLKALLHALSVAKRAADEWDVRHGLKRPKDEQPRRSAADYIPLHQC